MRRLHSIVPVVLFISLDLTVSLCAWGFGSVTEIACAPTRPEIAAVFADGAVWITLDHGKTWRFKGIPPNARRRAENEMTQSELGENDFLDIDEAESEAPDAARIDVAESDGAADGWKSEEMPGVSAVDNAGNAAWVQWGSLAIVSTQGRAWRELVNSGVRMASFDRRGRLFAASEDGIFCFSAVDQGARFLFKLPLRQPRSLLRGPSGEVRVFNHEGLYTIDESNAAARLRQIFPVHAGLAAAVVPFHGSVSAETWIIADARGFFEASVGKKKARRIAHSASVEKMLVDEHGEIRIFASRVGWRRLVRGAFVTVARFAVAVDAAGQFWQSDAFGLSVPDKRIEERGDSTSSRIGRPLQFSVPPGFRFPVPPPCRHFSIHPLPEIRLNLSVSGAQGSRRSEGRSVDRSLGFFLGAFFIWRIGNEDINGCRGRHERYENERLRLIRHTSDAAARLVEEEQRLKETRTIKEAVAARTARDKLKALLQFD